MRFYTNIQYRNNDILVREIDDGEPVKYRDSFQPTLYLQRKKSLEKGEVDYRTSDGTPLASIKPGTIQDCRKFMERYKNTDIVKFIINKLKFYTLLNIISNQLLELYFILLFVFTSLPSCFLIECVFLLNFMFEIFAGRKSTNVLFFLSVFAFILDPCLVVFG